MLCMNYEHCTVLAWAKKITYNKRIKTTQQFNSMNLLFGCIFPRSLNEWVNLILSRSHSLFALLCLQAHMRILSHKNVARSLCHTTTYAIEQTLFSSLSTRSPHSPSFFLAFPLSNLVGSSLHRISPPKYFAYQTEVNFGYCSSVATILCMHTFKKNCIPQSVCEAHFYSVSWIFSLM